MKENLTELIFIYLAYLFIYLADDCSQISKIIYTEIQNKEY